MKHRSKEEITKICDELYAIATKNWNVSLGYEALVKGGIVLGIAHEEETRIKDLETKLRIATEALDDCLLYSSSCEDLKHGMKLIANITRRALEQIGKEAPERIPTTDELFLKGIVDEKGRQIKIPRDN